MFFEKVLMFINISFYRTIDIACITLKNLIEKLRESKTLELDSKNGIVKSSITNMKTVTDVFTETLKFSVKHATWIKRLKSKSYRNLCVNRYVTVFCTYFRYQNKS